MSHVKQGRNSPIHLPHDELLAVLDIDSSGQVAASHPLAHDVVDGCIEVETSLHTIDAGNIRIIVDDVRRVANQPSDAIISRVDGLDANAIGEQRIVSLVSIIEVGEIRMDVHGVVTQ